MLESERTIAQELESLLTSFNAGWYRKPSIVNNLKKTLPINKNSYTHNLQEQQQQISEEKTHIIQICHWSCAKKRQHKQKSVVLVRWDVKLTAIKSNNKLVCYTRNARFLPDSLLEQTQVYFCCFEHIH